MEQLGRLVDAMNGFGVKEPIKNAVLRENSKYSSSKDIHEYLETKFHDDKQKCYYVLHPVDIHNIRSLI